MEEREERKISVGSRRPRWGRVMFLMHFYKQEAAPRLTPKLIDSTSKHSGRCQRHPLFLETHINT